VNVEKSSDETWLGVKGQSNSVIAGSPRNSLTRLPNPYKLRIPSTEFSGVSPWGISFTDKRGTTLTDS
jgi:hypothetical protein